MKERDLLKKETLKYVASIVMNTKERSLKRYEMIKNKYDMMFEYQRVIESFHNDMRLAMRVINGMSILDDSFLELGYIPDDPLNNFGIKSILWDGNLNSKLVSSNTFKGRFIMNMILTIDMNFDDILNDELKLIGKKKNQREAINLVYQIRDCIGNFIVSFSDRKSDYTDELKKISELVSLISVNPDKSKDAFKVANREIGRLHDMLNPGFLDGVKPSDDITVQNLLLLSYVLATDSANVKRTFTVPEDVNIKNTETVKTLIEVLGKCIIDKRDDGDIPEIYKWYLHALPKKYYRFSDVNYNEYLAEGCRAVSFLEFYANDKSISKLIKKLIY